MDKLRLLTNNVWCCWDNQPWWIERGMDCSSDARSEGISRVYEELLPDIIGWLEGDGKFQKHVPRILTEKGLKYNFVYGRLTPLMYNVSTLDLLETHHMVYPINAPGYEGEFNNNNTKSFTVGVFKVRASGKLIIFATTHLWWMSGIEGKGCYRPHSCEARAYQINLMLDVVEGLREKYNCPAVISGDLNDVYESPAVKAAMARGYRHAHDIATDFADERNGWHYCFPDGYDMYEEPKPFKEGIDHILVKGEPEGFVKRFERYTPEWYMPVSDHFPAYIDVEF